MVVNTLKEVLVQFYNNNNNINTDDILDLRSFMRINYSGIITALDTFPNLKKEFIDSCDEVDLQVATGDNDEYDKLICASVLKLIFKIINVMN